MEAQRAKLTLHYEMKEQIETLPPAAEQVLQHAVKSPLSALGIERLAAARVLNTVGSPKRKR